MNSVKSPEQLAADCPNLHNHNDTPGSYRGERWIFAKLLTHEQVKCSGCGLYVIWVKREMKITKFEVAEMLRCGNETPLEFLAYLKNRG